MMDSVRQMVIGTICGNSVAPESMDDGSLPFGERTKGSVLNVVVLCLPSPRLV
jgi:hypothetical protein